MVCPIKALRLSHHTSFMSFPLSAGSQASPICEDIRSHVRPCRPVRRHLVSNLLPMKSMHAGALRSVTCMAMEDGATLVSVPRDLFISFIAAKPRTLQIYLHKVHMPALHCRLCIVTVS